MLALFILLLGLTPCLVSLWTIRQSNARAQTRLNLVMESVAARGLAAIRLAAEHDYVEGLGYVTGDITCQFNARSPHLRCAVNPTGPCDQCSHYQSREFPALP